MRTGLKGLTVKKYTKSISTSHEFSSDWRSAILKPPATPAGMFVHRRFAIHPDLADTVARLAGLGVQEGWR